MRVLVTGASGFLGKEVVLQLAGHDVLTMSRKNANLNIDLSNSVPTIPTVDIVVHCAGKAHSVPKTAAEKEEFFITNVTGTKNCLEGLSKSDCLPKAFVFISSVAVYGREDGNQISEQMPLKATDPYGRSKIEAETLVKRWCLENNVICSILRLPLLVGKNPPGNLGAMIKGIKKGYYFNIGGGKAKKSLVLIEDIAKIIPKVAEVGGTYNLTDGIHPSFYELSLGISEQLRQSKPLNMPLWIAKIFASIGDLMGEKFPINTNKLGKMTSDLTFDDESARSKLGWQPKPVLKNLTME